MAINFHSVFSLFSSLDVIVLRHGLMGLLRYVLRFVFSLVFSVLPQMTGVWFCFLRV